MNKDEYKKIKLNYELKQMKTNAEIMPDCIGHNLVKVIQEPANFCIYYNAKQNYFYSIAKTTSGCINTCFGGIDHVKSLIKSGSYKKAWLTKYGRKILL